MSERVETAPLPTPNVAGTLRATNPFPNFQGAGVEAALVALVHVVSSDEWWVTVRVIEVLKGRQATDAETRVYRGRWNPTVGDEVFLFVSPRLEVLFATQFRRETLRIMAGLSSMEPVPLVSELLALYESADAVVEGTAYARSGTSALLRVDRVDKGALVAVPIDSDERVQIAIGYTTTDPGGPWSFSTSEFMTTRGFVGWFFLKQRADGTWSVENPLHPALLTHLEIERIHSVLDRP